MSWGKPCHWTVFSTLWSGGGGRRYVWVRWRYIFFSPNWPPYVREGPISLPERCPKFRHCTTNCNYGSRCTKLASTFEIGWCFRKWWHLFVQGFDEAWHCCQWRCLGKDNKARLYHIRGATGFAEFGLDTSGRFSWCLHSAQERLRGKSFVVFLTANGACRQIDWIRKQWYVSSQAVWAILQDFWSGTAVPTGSAWGNTNLQTGCFLQSASKFLDGWNIERSKRWIWAQAQDRAQFSFQTGLRFTFPSLRAISLLEFYHVFGVPTNIWNTCNQDSLMYTSWTCLVKNKEMLEKKARRKKHQVLRAQPRATPVPSSRIDTENVELVDVSSDADDASQASKSAIVSPVEIDPRDIDSDISMQYERNQGHVAEEGKPNLRCSGFNRMTKMANFPLGLAAQKRTPQAINNLDKMWGKQYILGTCGGLFCELTQVENCKRKWNSLFQVPRHQC